MTAKKLTEPDTTAVAGAEQANTAEQSGATVKVRFVTSSFGIAAGEVKEVDRARAAELAANYLAVPA